MNINPSFKNHFIKIVITSLFVIAVWFVSFAIFPENQVVKFDVGDPSPMTFYAPKYIEIEGINYYKVRLREFLNQYMFRYFKTLI